MSKKAKRWIGSMGMMFLAVIVVGKMARADHEDQGNHDYGRAILAFHTMYGVDGPFTDPANALRGIVGDEDAWKLASAAGFLATDGHLKIHVRGLIFGDGRPNDEGTFRGAVSCLTEDEAAGTTPVVNVITDGFPATPEGDSDIDATVVLPNPCVAPVVFVLAGSEDKWFSVTGFESSGGSGSNPPSGGHDHQGGDNNDQGDDQD
jgi:hypothetical protein